MFTEDLVCARPRSWPAWSSRLGICGLGFIQQTLNRRFPYVELKAALVEEKGDLGPLLASNSSWGGFHIAGRGRWDGGPGGRACVSGGTGNYTMKAQRQRFPGTFKDLKEVQLAGVGPQARERERDKRRRPEKEVLASDHVGP